MKKGISRWFLIGAILALMAGLLPPVVVSAAESGTTSGSFSVGNVVPVVAGVEIYSDSALTTVVTNMIPQVIYYIKVSVSCPNSLDDVKLVTVKIFHDLGGVGTDEATINTGDPLTAAILTWTKSTGLWTINAGSPTSWTIESSLCRLPADLTASSGYGVFAFKPGKVASECVGSDCWRIFSRVTGSSDLNSGLYSSNKKMMWYGETTMLTPNVVWGAVSPGTGFADHVNEVSNITVTFISNGNYQEEVKSAATWAGNLNTAIFDSQGTCENMKEFSLMACLSANFTNAVQVDTTGAMIQNTDTGTSEAGETHINNTLWLKLASTFPVDLYTGIITYIIANR